MSKLSKSDEPNQLVLLGRRFAARHKYREALEVFQLALRLDPENTDLKLALAQMQKTLAGQKDGEPTSPSEESLRRETIDAAHLLGLAQLYAERGNTSDAFECLQLAKAKSAVLPAPYKLHGKLLAKAKDFEGAAEQFRLALRFNPFDTEVAEQLGKVEYERKRYEDALSATIDAFLLLPTEGSDRAQGLTRRVRTLKRILNWENRKLVRLFHERKEVLSTAFDRLQWHRERFLEEQGVLERGLGFGQQRLFQAKGRISLAARMRQLDLWSHLSDEAIFKLTPVVQEEFRPASSLVFAYGSDNNDLYFLERGEILIQRPSSYGTFPLGILKPGELFGEVNFVHPSERSAEAITTQPSHLLRLEAEALHEVIQRNPDLGVQLYSSFWQGLARKLRSTNERLRTFFSVDSLDALPERISHLPPHEEPETEAQLVEVDSDAKIRLFREQGLSRKELLTLATFSTEKHYPEGSYLFRENDPGDDMYVILEGRVRISKFIPGGGEEALAILDRGDFFGELSLIDGQPRSADARAHAGPVTVLTLDQATLKEVLAMDPEAALEFLQLLCRLIAKRLREVDEKLVAWHILSGREHRQTRADLEN